MRPMKQEGIDNGGGRNKKGIDELPSPIEIPYLKNLNSELLKQQVFSPQGGIQSSRFNVLSPYTTTQDENDRNPRQATPSDQFFASTSNLHTINPTIPDQHTILSPRAEESNNLIDHHAKKEPDELLHQNHQQEQQKQQQYLQKERDNPFAVKIGIPQSKVAQNFSNPLEEVQEKQHGESHKNERVNEIEQSIAPNMVGESESVTSKKEECENKPNENKDQFRIMSSMHLHFMMHDSGLLKEEMKKVLLVFVVGILVEVLLTVRRGISSENMVFIAFAILSMLVSSISILPILAYMKALPNQINSVHTKKFIFHVLAQILRTIVFCNSATFPEEAAAGTTTSSSSTPSSTRYNRITAVEAVLEMIMVCSLSEQVLINFPILRIRSKLMTLNFSLLVLSTFSLIEYDDVLKNSQLRDFLIQLVLGGLLIGFLLFKSFILREFPFNFGKIYNAKEEEYLQMKRSYLSDMRNSLSMSKSTKQLENQHVGGAAAGPSQKTPYETAKSLNPENAVGTAAAAAEPGSAATTKNKQNERQIELDETYSKKLQTSTSNFVVLDQTMDIVYMSDRMDKIISTVISEREKRNGGGGGVSNAQKLNTPNSNQDRHKFFKRLLNTILLERIDEATTKIWDEVAKAKQKLPEFSTLNSKMMFKQNTPQEIGMTPQLHFLSPFDQQQAFQQHQQFNPTTASLAVPPIYVTQSNAQYSNPQATYKDMISAKNSVANFNKFPGLPSVPLLSPYSGFVSKIGLKQKFIMIKLKQFLAKISILKESFGAFDLITPIVVACFSFEGDPMATFSEQQEWNRYQLKIYPLWKHNQEEEEAAEAAAAAGGTNYVQQNTRFRGCSNDSLDKQSLGLTTSQKYIYPESDGVETHKKGEFLLVFEEIKEREKVVNKAQFYKLLKSVFRCFNNDLSRSLGNILQTSQAGIRNAQLSESLKDQFVRPVLLSCKIIKYILHNLRDFNDLAGEKFALQMKETSVPKVAEDSVMLFKATSNKKLSFKVVISDEVPILIVTDQRRLMQIIITLLSNAYKHTTSGSLLFRIYHPKVAEYTVHNQLRFQIEDTGEGMERSIQSRLAKLFNSGIGYQDFKTISNFGFNLFICNIIAKKLFNPQYQFTDQQQNPFDVQAAAAAALAAEPIASPDSISGIKFSSIPGRGSVFYFDIKLPEERRFKVPDQSQMPLQPHLQQIQKLPHLSQYVQKDYEIATGVSRQYSAGLQLEIPLTSFDLSVLKNHQRLKDQVVITNSIPSINPSAVVSESEKEQLMARMLKRQGSSLRNNPQIDEIPDEENQEIKTMYFQSQPRGMHNDYKFLKCNCASALIIDKVSLSSNALEQVLESNFFKVQKCASLSSAVELCNEKEAQHCSVCNSTVFVCIFIAIDDFLKPEEQPFINELEVFLQSNHCMNSVIIAISHNNTPASKKLLDNPRIDDFLSPMFDSIEFFDLISKWRLLPLQSTETLFNLFTNSKEHCIFYNSNSNQNPIPFAGLSLDD